MTSRVDYHAYINHSWKWWAKSKLCKWGAGNRCQLCNAPGDKVSLHAHHRTYARLGRERLSDLICLCGKCHRAFHQHCQLWKDRG